MKKTLFACLFIVAGAGVILLFGEITELHSGVKKLERSVEYSVVISDVAPLKELEEVPVRFYHDKHVSALEEEGCGACHRQDSNKNFLFTYPRERVETSRRALMDSYHDSCIGCHDARLAEEKSSGPVACGECHAPKREKEWMQPAGFDHLLHYKHEAGMNHECGVCHHDYNEKEKQLVYQEGTESSCRDCHRDIGDPEMPSFRDAAHSGCVNCHMNKEEAGEKTGPTACIGCHGEKERRTIEALVDVPRPDRNQPETIFMHSDDASMPGVSFNHKIHENSTNTCRTCHHETLNSCDQCHTSQGSIEGGGVTLVDAFHKKTSLKSCVGCHDSMKEEALCAGCHSSMKDASMSENSCSTCHAGSQERANIAGNMSRQSDLLAAMPDDDIVINVLEDRYEPSKFPHSMVIGKLLDISRDNRLANTFHKDELTMCEGCHHYSSPEHADQPPLCRSCHTIDFNPEDLGKPRLLASYHLQCMGCHEKMRIDAVDCTSCHSEKGDDMVASQKTRVTEGKRDSQ